MAQAIFPWTKSINSLNEINGNGLTISYRYIRNIHPVSSAMVNIALLFKNETDGNITDVHMGKTVSKNSHRRI